MARAGDRGWHRRCLGWQAFRGLGRTAGRVTGPVDRRAGRDGKKMSPDRGHAFRRVAAGAHHGNPAAVRGRKLRETHMKTTQRHNNRAGFTLIEMVGVLAVIAILAALLVPKIFAAINESRLNNALGGINTCKTAAIQYFTKNGSFPSVDTSDFDGTLLTQGFLDKELEVKLGTAADCEIEATTSTGAAEGGSDGNGRFDLDGDAAADVPENASVVQVVLTNVKPDDARELSLRLDGSDMSAGDTSTADKEGRVAYATPSGGLATVYVYLAHK
jgi:prepilin-type N-terminal cleavage/methylation domain-containing protein